MLGESTRITLKDELCNKNMHLKTFTLYFHLFFIIYYYNINNTLKHTLYNIKYVSTYTIWYIILLYLTKHANK